MPARSSRTSVARCRGAGAFIGSGRPDWRRHSAVAGPLGLGGNGRDFTHADEISPGTLETKIPLLVAGHQKAVLLVPRRERRRVALLYGREAIAGNIRRIESGFDRVVFIPCQDKPRTVWPGGLLLASRKRITLRVEAGGRTHTLRLG